VVLLTGAFEPVDEGRTRSLGVDGVLAKPFEPQMAIGLVRRLLDQPPVQAGSVGGGSDTSASAEAKPDAGAAWSGGVGETSALGAGSGFAAGYPFEPRVDEPPAPSQVDDYFRRLDEALATAGLAVQQTKAPEPEAPPPSAEGDHAGRSGAEERTMIESTTLDATSFEDAPTLILQSPEDVERHDAEASEPSSAPMLVDAFAALLAVEQGEPGATVPAWSAASAPAGDNEAIVEAVTRRVLERMTDAAVREVVTARVLEVAERVVREEIERIKAQAGE
jgi:hypothetical protein